MFSQASVLLTDCPQGGGGGGVPQALVPGPFSSLWSHVLSRWYPSLWSQVLSPASGPRSFLGYPSLWSQVPSPASGPMSFPDGTRVSGPRSFLQPLVPGPFWGTPVSGPRSLLQPLVPGPLWGRGYSLSWSWLGGGTPVLVLTRGRRGYPSEILGLGYPPH